MVELSSKYGRIAIDRKLIGDTKVEPEQTARGESVYGGATVYDAGKTPMNYNTPSYYPQSPHWGAAHASPGADCNLFINVSNL